MGEGDRSAHVKSRPSADTKRLKSVEFVALFDP